MGVMFDAARALENRSYYPRAIEFLARRGVNTVLWHFTDDQGCAMQFDSVPGIASPNAYSKSEMRELVLFARECGIELIPEVASLGHTVYLTRLPQYRHLAESEDMFSSMCPAAQQTRELVQALIEEAATVFDGPNFHVGLDETNFGQHRLSAEALKTRTRTEIFADHINFVHGVVTGLGRHMWMWADGLLHDRELAARLPRDIVMCNWKYRPTEPPESTQYLLDQGFDVLLCSASISSQQMLFPGEQFALPNIRSLQAHRHLQPSISNGAKVLGQINTIWTPVRYLADSLWLGIDLALAILGEGAEVDVHERIGRFGSEFYGLDQVESFVEASRILLEQSPQRDEWLTVLNLRPITDEAVRKAIITAAPRWREASRLLGGDVGPRVRLHQQEFSTFRQMIDLAAHAYEVAAAFPTMSAAAAAIAAFETSQVLAEIEATWDRERYADDPRKYAAPIHHFDGDHLIPMIRLGLLRLQDRATGVADNEAAASTTIQNSW